MSYKRNILLSILSNIYPGKNLTCGTTYNSIILLPYGTLLVPESEISSKYNEYTIKYNLNILRFNRNILLQESDRYGLSDYPFSTPEIKLEWFDYRTALRNITSEYPCPDVNDEDELINITWPTKPSSS